ncbi:tetratricopeptide repeat protein [Saccharicrinis sp. FJH62]|uniref:tetratricopeptide repeat-containing sensor histidine kinase n=1 Tax=Saccharicrinis sp. FJH62 TaxID=3344657 RepID=UPI0035D3E0F8
MFLRSDRLFVIIPWLFIASVLNSRYSYGIEPETRFIPDTSIVISLFEKGNQFIDGPSDSLVHYYSKALDLIKNNLKDSDEMKRCEPELLLRYKRFEFRAFIELGIEYFYRNNYDKALVNFGEALKVATAINDVDLLSECNSEIGIVYKNQGDYDKALTYYDLALDMAKHTSDSSWIVSCQINMANVFKEKGFLTIAQGYYFEALSTLERLKHDRRLAACYQNIGEIYQKQRDYKPALDYYNKSLDLGKSANDMIRQIVINLNIGYVKIMQKDYPEARKYLFQALKLYEETGYQHEMDECYLLLGDTYLHENDLDEAKQYFMKALDIAEKKNDRKSKVESKRRLGNAALRSGDFKTAGTYFQKAYEEAKQLGALDLRIETGHALSAYLDTTGRYKDALYYAREEMQLKDSLFNSEKYKAIKELEIRHNLEKKDQQLSLLTEQSQVQELKLSRRNRMLFALGAVIILIIVISYLLYVQNKLKEKHKAMELEQQLLRSQMNPHFIFNSLIAIQSYIYKKEPVLAGDYLAKFADLIRLTLENSRHEFVPLSKEIKTMQTYIDLQLLRFDHKFNYTLKVDESLNKDAYLIPPMFAQPFIENAIEHGLRHLTEKGLMEIRYINSGKERIRIEVKDNGIGRDASEKLKPGDKHASLAMQITRDRLMVLSGKYRERFDFRIEDLTNKFGHATGTMVEITLPLKGN